MCLLSPRDNFYILAQALLPVNNFSEVFSKFLLGRCLSDNFYILAPSSNNVKAFSNALDDFSKMVRVFLRT